MYAVAPEGYHAEDNRQMRLMKRDTRAEEVQWWLVEHDSLRYLSPYLYRARSTHVSNLMEGKRVSSLYLEDMFISESDTRPKYHRFQLESICMLMKRGKACYSMSFRSGWSSSAMFRTP